QSLSFCIRRTQALGREQGHRIPTIFQALCQFVSSGPATCGPFLFAIPRRQKATPQFKWNLTPWPRPLTLFTIGRTTNEHPVTVWRQAGWIATSLSFPFVAVVSTASLESKRSPCWCRQRPRQATYGSETYSFASISDRRVTTQ